MALSTPSAVELLVSWRVDSGTERSYLTLGEVIACHGPEDEAALIGEHVGCLNEVASILMAGSAEWLRPGQQFEPYADAAFSATIEGLIDFAAEVAGWSLARIDLGVGDVVDWGPAMAAMRTLGALSAAVTVLDAAREGLHRTD